MKHNANLLGDLWDKGIGAIGFGSKSRRDRGAAEGGGRGRSSASTSGASRGDDKGTSMRSEDKVYTIRENQKGALLRDIRRLKQAFGCKIQIDNHPHNGKLGVYTPGGVNDKQGLQREIKKIISGGTSS